MTERRRTAIWSAESATRERDAALWQEDAARVSEVVGAAIDAAANTAELRRFLYESLVLAVVFRLADSADWVERYDARLRESSLPERERKSAVALCRLVLTVGRRGRTLSRDEVVPISWEILGEDPWLQNIRLSFALNGDEENVARRLGSATEDRIRPVDLGYRYALLASDAARAGRSERFFAFHARADELFRKDGSLLAHLRRLNLEIDHGIVHTSRGDFHLAGKCFEEVLDFDARFRRRTLFAASAMHLADLCLRRGQPRRARELLDRYGAGLIEADPGPVLRLHIDQMRAEIHAAQGDATGARVALVRAEELVAELPHDGFRAALLRTRARIEALDRTEESYAKAFATLDESDRILRARGRNGLLELSQNLVTRGQFHLARSEGEEALRACLDALEIAREHELLPVWVRALILKSYLLLETGRDTSESLYEQVLLELGLVRDPALLFEVIANLYLYTWNLERTHLDLTDTHLKQLHRLREVLEPEHFQSLYGRLVLRRVLERFGRERGGK